MWFVFTIITTLLWGIAELFYKKGSHEDQKYDHLRVCVLVGAVMGIHAYYEPVELIGKTLVAITNLPPRKMMGIESCGMLLSAVHTQNGEERLNLLMVSNKIAAGAKLY